MDGDGVVDDVAEDDVVLTFIFMFMFIFIHNGITDTDEDDVVAIVVVVGVFDPRDKTRSGSDREIPGSTGAIFLGCGSTYFSAKVSKIWSYGP